MRTILLLGTCILVGTCAACSPSSSSTRPTAQSAGPAVGSPTHPSAPASAPNEERAGATATTPPVVIAVPASLGLDASAASDVQVLANAAAFRGEAVGYSGEPVPAVAALRRLVSHPHAPEILRLVQERGTLAAQLLALAGMYVKDNRAFVAAIGTYRVATAKVKVLRGGCDTEADEVAVRDLVSVPGAMQLARPDETLAEWSRRFPPPQNLVVDLEGGGLSLLLLGS